MDVSKFTLGGKPIYAANKLREEFQKRNWDSSGFWGIANSYRVFAGRQPAIGFVIMLRKDVEDLIALQRPYHTLMIGRGDKEIRLAYTVIESACNLGNTIAEDPKTPVLVKLTDWKHYARRAIINKQFNVRSRRDVRGDYYSENNAAVADYETILDYFKTLWASQTQTGIDTAVQGLIIRDGTPEPTSGPENLRYIGMNAWDALCDFYARMGCVLVCDPTTALTLTAVRAGWLDDASTFMSNYRDLVSKNRGRLVSHSNPIVNEFARLPEKVTICFRKAWEQVRESVEYTSPVYTVDYLQTDYVAQLVESDETGRVTYSSSPGTVEILWDESLEAVMAHSLTHSSDPTNKTDLESRAEYLGLRWFYHNDPRNMLRKIYGDILKFTPCEIVSEVAWYDLGAGPHTEVICRIPELSFMKDSRPHVFDLLEGFLTADMDPSTGNGDTETTATMAVRGGKGANWGSSSFSITLTNRDDHLKGKSGAKAVAVRIAGEWRPIFIGCFPGNEIQKIAASGTVSGGTYKLSFNGVDSANINHNDNAATIKTSLEAMSTIGTGNVDVTGGALPSSPVYVEFKGTLANTGVEKLVVKSSLTGGGTYVVTVTNEGCCD